LVKKLEPKPTKKSKRTSKSKNKNRQEKRTWPRGSWGENVQGTSLKGMGAQTERRGVTTKSDYRP